MNPEWRARYEVAVDAARKAARLALGYFEGSLAVEWKKDHSPVTAADREAEQLLRTTLLGAFPGDGFLGEESGALPGSSGFRWVIDPIDGTRNFVRGIPLWGTLVALEFKEEQIAGVVELPALGQRFRALRGDGAYQGERRIRVSDVATLNEATVFYTSLSALTHPGTREALFRLADRAQMVRGYGDCYGYMLVAQGSGEMMMEYGMNPWDIAAARVIVEEAGGRWSNWDGGGSIRRPDSLASNGRLHEEALRTLKLG
jgi:histidinol-phosphatase